MRTLLVLLPLLILFSCGKIMGEEVARLPVDKVSFPENVVEQEVEIELFEGDDLSIWSDMNFSYTDGAELWWELEILLNGESFNNLKLDPLDKDLTLNSKETNFNGEISTSFSGRNYKMSVRKEGTYTFISRLFSNGDESIIVEKAHLVIKKHE